MTNFKTSNIRILLSLQKAFLQQVIDTQLPVLLLEKFKIDNPVEIEITIKRKTIPEIQVENNSIKYQVPLELRVEKKTLLGKIDTAFEILLNMESKFLIKENWELATRTKLIDYQWITKPKLDLGIMDIPLEGILSDLIESKKEELAQQLDHQLKEISDFPNRLEYLIKNTPNPIRTPAGAEVWWQSENIQTAMTTLNEKDGFIFGKVGLKLDSEFSYGSELEKIKPVIIAPDLVRDLEKESQIQTQIKLDFKTVEKTAIALLQKQSFEFKNRKIEVAAVRVAKDGQRLKVYADLKGSFDGSMTLRGKPIFDRDKKQIQLAETELDLQGNNFLSKTMVVLLSGIIESQISKFLNFPIQNSIDFANEKIKYFPFQNGFIIKAKIHEFDIPNLELQEKALILNLSLNGDLELSFENINQPT